MVQLESNGNTLVQCGASLLLEDRTSFEYYWDKLPKDEQDEFVKTQFTSLDRLCEFFYL